MNELSSTAVSDSQSSARGTRQRGGQRGDQRGDQRSGRGERVGGVPEVMTNVFQM